MKYKSIKEYLAEQGNFRKEDIKDMILRSALHLVTNCAHNFDGEAEMTEQAALPLSYFNEILDSVD